MTHALEQEVKDKHLATIQRYFDMGRYEEAAKFVTALLDADPTDPQALYFMAVVLLSREDYPEARRLCKDALHHGFDKETCLHFIGTTYQYEMKYQEAEQAYLEALEINPNSADLHASYGHLMLLTGFEDKALKLLEEAMKIDPDSDRVNQFVLNFYFAKSDRANQLTHIEHIMETSSSEEQKLVNLAIYHLLLHEEKQAREFFRQAFLLDPTNDYLLHMLEELDESTHPIFWAHRFMNKIGGPAVVWIGFMVIAFLLSMLNQDIILVVFATIYIIFAIYTWIAHLLYKWFVKGRMR